MKITLLCLIVMVSTSAWGWDEDDHQLMTRKALEQVAAPWGLDRPVAAQPLASFLKKISSIRPELGDRWHWSDFLRINPKIDLDGAAPEASDRTSIAPWEILSLYSVDPDDGRDQDLFIRDEKGRPMAATPDQFWFGALQGPDSQAFRHIEKPPFDWRNPGTFGLPLRAIGEATRRSEIYFLASRLAFSLGEDYWGWRFLAGSLHYIEDLHQPYHAGQITPDLLLKGLWSYLSWGYREKGLMGTFSHVVSNSHRYYEGLVSFPPESDRGAKEEALRLIEGTDAYSRQGTVQELAVMIRDESNRYFPPLIAAITEVADPILLSPYSLKDHPEAASNPAQFLRKDSSSVEARKKIFEITRERFKSAGKAVRTVIDLSINKRGEATPEQTLIRLDEFLPGSTRPIGHDESLN